VSGEDVFYSDPFFDQGIKYSLFENHPVVSIREVEFLLNSEHRPSMELFNGNHPIPFSRTSARTPYQQPAPNDPP
jgi:hypothetical protein